jgi:hypothetical protein
VTVERFPRVASLRDHPAVKLFDGDAIGREVGFLIWGTKRLNRRPFAVQRHGHPSRRRILRLALDLPQLAAADDGRLHRAELAPPFEPSVRRQHGIEQAGHGQ